jgi:hypothetical protein
MENSFSNKNTKFKALSDIYRDIAQVFFASMFVGPLATGAVRWQLLISGLILSTVFWLFCLSAVEQKS